MLRQAACWQFQLVLVHHRSPKTKLRQIHLDGCCFQERYGWAFAKYSENHPYLYYWEMVVLVRKLSIGIIVKYLATRPMALATLSSPSRGTAPISSFAIVTHAVPATLVLDVEDETIAPYTVLLLVYIILLLYFAILRNILVRY